MGAEKAAILTSDMRNSGKPVSLTPWMSSKSKNVKDVSSLLLLPDFSGKIEGDAAGRVTHQWMKVHFLKKGKGTSTLTTD